MSGVGAASSAGMCLIGSDRQSAFRDGMKYNRNIKEGPLPHVLHTFTHYPMARAGVDWDTNLRTGLV